MRPDPKRQIAKAEALAGLYRPYGDPETQAADIADAIRPLIATRLAAIRSPLPPSPEPDAVMMKACRELATALDRYEEAKAGNGRLTAYRSLQRVERAARAIRKLIVRKGDTPRAR